jgi:type IV pilus assembly protein PilV
MKHTLYPSPNKARRFRPSRQRGVGLIEVLVAVLILSLGLLGMAGLQAKSLRANQSSYARTQAVMLSYYILDAMRADKSNAITLAYNTGTSTAITPICSVSAATGTGLWAENQRDWIESLRATLGDQDTTCGSIICDGGGLCTVQVIWDDSRAGGLGTQVIETQSRL